MWVWLWFFLQSCFLHSLIISLHFFKPLPVPVLSLLFLISHLSFACLGLIPSLTQSLWGAHLNSLFLSANFQFLLIPPLSCSKKSVLMLTSSSFLFSFVWQFHATPASWLYLLSCPVNSPILPICLLMPTFPNLGFQKLLCDSSVYLPYSKPLFLFGVLQASHLTYLFLLSPVISSIFFSHISVLEAIVYACASSTVQAGNIGE